MADGGVVGAEKKSMKKMCVILFQSTDNRDSISFKSI